MSLLESRTETFERRLVVLATTVLISCATGEDTEIWLVIASACTFRGIARVFHPSVNNASEALLPAALQACLYCLGSS